MSLGERFPYHVTLSTDEWWVIEEWCVATVGEFDQDWYKLGIDPAAYIMHGDRRTTWFFRNEQDAIMFVLRWGSGVESE